MQKHRVISVLLCASVHRWKADPLCPHTPAGICIATPDFVFSLLFYIILPYEPNYIGHRSSINILLR